MGVTKTRVTGCFDAAEYQHILTIGMGEFPNLSGSASLCRIVREHRLWYESRQRLLYPPKSIRESLQVSDSSLGETGETRKHFCAGPK